MIGRITTLVVAQPRHGAGRAARLTRRHSGEVRGRAPSKPLWESPRQMTVVTKDALFYPMLKTWESRKAPSRRVRRTTLGGTPCSTTVRRRADPVANLPIGMGLRLPMQTTRCGKRPVARPYRVLVVERRPLLNRTHDKAKGGLNGHTRGGGCPIEARILRTLRQWVTSIGRWSCKDNVGNNHTAEYVMMMSARVICGHSQTARAFLKGLGEDDAKNLITTIAPLLITAWRQGQVDTSGASELISNLLGKAVAMAKERRRKDFDDWLARALTDGARAAHRFVSRGTKPPPLELVVTEGSGPGRSIISGPDQAAEHYAGPWRRLWRCGQAGRYEEEMKLIRSRCNDLRDEAVQCASFLDLSPRAIRGACASFRAGTDIGADGVPFTLIASLPDVALQLLGDMIRTIIAHSAIPSTR